MAFTSSTCTGQDRKRDHGIFKIYWITTNKYWCETHHSSIHWSLARLFCSQAGTIHEFALLLDPTNQYTSQVMLTITVRYKFHTSSPGLRNKSVQHRCIHAIITTNWEILESITNPRLCAFWERERVSQRLTVTVQILSIITNRGSLDSFTSLCFEQSIVWESVQQTFKTSLPKFLLSPPTTEGAYTFLPILGFEPVYDFEPFGRGRDCSRGSPSPSRSLLSSPTTEGVWTFALVFDFAPVFIFKHFESQQSVCEWPIDLTQSPSLSRSLPSSPTEGALTLTPVFGFEPFGRGRECPRGSPSLSRSLPPSPTEGASTLYQSPSLSILRESKVCESVPQT